MRIAAALLALLLAPATAKADTTTPPPLALAAAYPRLHQAAVEGPAHAGRDVLAHGRPSDGRPSLALLLAEARRLWRELHPSAFPPQPTAPAWWVAAAAPLRWCEARGNYATDTGNGFYGAYQFLWSTWASMGGQGNPAQATPAEQDYRAWQLWQRAGSAPWPQCGVSLP